MIINCCGQPFDTDRGADLAYLLAFLDAHPVVSKENADYNLVHLVQLFSNGRTYRGAKSKKNRIVQNGAADDPIKIYSKDCNDVKYISWHDFQRFFLNHLRGPLAVYYRSFIFRDGVGVQVGSQMVIDTATANRDDENLAEHRQLYDEQRARGQLDLVDQIEEEDDGSGFIYAVTSPIYPYIKLGHWRGLFDNGFRSRYTPTLGADLQLMTKAVVDRRQSERDMLAHFAADKVTNELFRKHILPRLLEYMQ